MAEEKCDHHNVLCEGKNCWRIAPAKRVSFLIDAASYFAAFMAAVQRARQSVLMVGWDFHSRLDLLHDKEAGERAVYLGDFLNDVVAYDKGLQAHILCWDFAMIYGLEREHLPVFKLDWQTHPRLHFRLDGNHPIGASHHQKIVVIDDAFGFVGGIDLTKNRWDTQAHLADDPRRVDPDGKRYGPFHDVQMAVDGSAAAALGRLIRERWQRATGRSLKPPESQQADPWPPELEPDMEEVDIAISRTEAEYQDREEVREVEKLHRDAIAAAQRHLYIENQYLTSSAIGDALAARLQEKDGPEVVMVLPRKSPGWLEQATMGALRAKLLQHLHQQDLNNRLRTYYPVVPESGDQDVHVHAKVLVADDSLVKVGSSNLSNRSMGLDTECDLAIESKGDNRTKRAIAEFRNRLLGEHLGVTEGVFADTLATEKSLIAAVEKLRGTERTLEPLNIEVSELTRTVIPISAITDPERTIDPETFIKELLPSDMKKTGKKRFLLLGIILLLMLGLSAAWRWTPLGEWISIERVSNWAYLLRGSPASPLIVLGGYVLGSMVLVPITAMILATAFIFGPILGFTYSLSGCLLGAMATYICGRFVGRDTVRRLAGSRVNRLSRRLGKHGLLTVASVRLVPIAPFIMVNLVAGASHIRFRDFVLGTILGMAPGILAITVFERQLEVAIREPGAGSIAILAMVIGVIALIAVIVPKRLRDS